MKSYGGLTFDKKRPYTFVTSVAETVEFGDFRINLQDWKLIAPVLFGVSSSSFLYWNHQFHLYLLRINQILWRLTKKAVHFCNFRRKTGGLTIFVSIFKIESFIAPVLFGVSSSVFFFIGITNSFSIYYIQMKFYGGFTFDKIRAVYFRNFRQGNRGSDGFGINL